MKRIVAVALMIGGIIGTSGQGFSSTDGKESYEASMQAQSVVVTADIKINSGGAAAQVQEPTAPVEPSASPDDTIEKSVLELSSVGGIALHDTPDMVIAKMGNPLSISQDELWTELDIYEYPALQVAFYGEFVQYVDVPAGEQLFIDGELVPMTEIALRERLGEPDYTADDGIVFQRGPALLKLFIDYDTNEPMYVSYYHIATV